MPASNQITLPAAGSAVLVRVAVIDDVLTESTESVILGAGSSSNPLVSTGDTGSGSILNNDAPPTLDLDSNNSTTTGTNYLTTFTEGGAAVAIADTDIVITDADSTAMAGATITLTNAQAGDVLTVGLLSAGITASIVGNVITLTGSSSLANYQAALRSITFSNTQENPSSTARNITVVVTDGTTNSNTATTTVTVVPVNDAPVVNNATASGSEDTAIPVTVTGSDIDGTIGVFTLASLPVNGRLYLDAAMTQLAATGVDYTASANARTFYFMPSSDWNGSTAFTYTSKDNAGLVSNNTATATITVSPVNDGAPVATNDAYQALVGQTITFTRADLMANDLLLDNATITANGALPTGLTYNSATQTYTYTPAAAGSGSFSYTLTDQDGQTSTGSVSLAAYNARDDLASVNESALSAGSGAGVSSASGSLWTNDVGLSGNITAITGPAGTTVTLVGNTYTATTPYGTLVVDRTTGSYTYTLSDNVDNDSASGATPLNLVEQFTYTRTGGSANLQITIVDDAPSVQSHSVEVPQSGAATNYNLILMLDVSGSMINTGDGGAVRVVDANGNATISNRLAVAKQALIDMVSKYYDESANVTVKVGYFSGTATAGTTLLTTKAEAIAAINAIPASGGSTNYEDGLYKIQDMFGTIDTSKTNIAYFVSDGVPTTNVGGSGTLTPTTETNAPANPVSYSQFLTNNPSVQSYAIGIGGGISNTAPLDSIHNVDADESNTKDSAILVNDLNQLSAALTATIPPSFGGNVGTTGGNPYVKIGADGGYVRYIDVVLDSNDADTAADTTVRFTFNGTNQITYDEFYRTGVHTTVTLNATLLTLNSTLGFTKGTLVFNFENGDYSYYTQGAASSGDQIDIGFSVVDRDGDVASAVESIKIINGRPVANADRDTLFLKNTFFEGNVVTATGTDGAGQAVTVFNLGAGADNTVDNAKVTSITFNGATFNLTTPSSGTLGGGSYSVNAANELTWTSSTDGSTLVFHSDGYYKYTPPASQTTAPTTGAQQTVGFESDPTASGVTLQGVTRTGNINAPDGTINYGGSPGVGISGGGSNQRVDNLETLLITFNRATYAQGVTNLQLNINAGNSNLGTGTAIAVTVYDIAGNLLGQIAITSEGYVTLPSTWSSIGSIRIEPNSNASVMIDGVRFNAVNLNSAASNIPDQTIGYTLTDEQGDSSSSSLTLHIVTNEVQGTTGADTLTGTTGNDALSGFEGNDTLNGGSGGDIIKGGTGVDTIDGGADDDQLYGNEGNDIVLGGSGKDYVEGGAGNDDIQGGAGNDELRGNEGNDTIRGDAGADLINGGAGNDTLYGGTTALTDGLVDTFKWQLSDRGTTGASAASDTIIGFDVAPVSSNGDILDLRDLLTAEVHTGLDTGNLANYLHFEYVGGNTIAHISSAGQFAGGYQESKQDQVITLQGVNLVGSFSNDQQIVADLLSKGKLITD
nr:Ig-like domain-containing protein [uncultured Rhodoferax sp.]